MAKTSKGRRRRDWRRIIFLTISIMIVLSMLVSSVIVALTPAGP